MFTIMYESFRKNLFMPYIFHIFKIIHLRCFFYTQGPIYKTLVSSLLYRPASTTMLSAITFNWMNGVLVQGYKNVLELDDLGDLPQVKYHSCKLLFYFSIPAYGC